MNNLRNTLAAGAASFLRALTLIAMTLTFACGSTDETSSGMDGGAEGGADGAGDAKWTIGMSQCNLGEPWRVQMNKDIETAAAKHPEIKVVFKDAQNDTLRQRSHVEEFQAQQVDLLIISPKEAVPLAQPVKDLMAAGIPVIVLDRDIAGEPYTMFIGADNERIGKAAGEWVKANTGENAKIVELKGLMTSTPGQDRHNGFRAGIEGGGAEVIFDADCQWLEPNGRKEMESALGRFEKIDVVYAHNDPVAHGAWLAAKAAGREGEIKFVGIDALPHEGVAYVKQGIMDVTFQYPTGGAEAIEFALKILSGETVPKRLTLGTRMFTAQNADSGGEALN